MSQLQDVAVFERNLYVITWQDNRINRLAKFDANNYTAVLEDPRKPFVLHVYHRQRQPLGKLSEELWSLVR